MKIGLAAPFTRYDSRTAYDALFAAKLALKERNEKSGVRGYRVELVAMDDENDAEVAARRARELAADGDVLAVIGHLSDGSALKAAAEYQRAGLPLLTFASSSLLTAKGDKSVLRLGPSDDQLARAVLESLAGKVDLDRVAFFQDERLPAASLADAFQRELAARGGAVILRGTVDPLSRGFAEIIDQLRENPAQLVVFQGDYRQSAVFYAELRQALGQMAFLSVGSDTPDFAKVGGERLRGAMYVARWPLLNRETDSGTRFFAQYLAATGVEPLSYAPITYDAVNMLLDAAESSDRGTAKPVRRAVARELARTGEFAGIAGALAFDEKGDLKISRPVVYRSEAPGTYPGVEIK